MQGFFIAGNVENAFPKMVYWSRKITFKEGLLYEVFV